MCVWKLVCTWSPFIQSENIFWVHGVQAAVLGVSDGGLAHLGNDTGILVVTIKKPGVFHLSVPSE